MHLQRAVGAGNTAERRASKWTTEGEGEIGRGIFGAFREYPKTQAGVNRKGMFVLVERAGKVIFRRIKVATRN